MGSCSGQVSTVVPKGQQTLLAVLLTAEYLRQTQNHTDSFSTSTHTQGTRRDLHREAGTLGVTVTYQPHTSTNRGSQTYTSLAIHPDPRASIPTPPSGAEALGQANRQAEGCA